MNSIKMKGVQPNHGSQKSKTTGLSIQKDYKTGKHITFKPAQNKKSIKRIGC